MVPLAGPNGVHSAASSTPNGVITPNMEETEVQDGLQQMMATGSLRPHQFIAEVYGSFHAEEDSLLASIQSQRVLSSLLVTPNGTVLAGDERLRVAQRLDIKEVPVRVLVLASVADIEETVIESNVARQKRSSSTSASTAILNALRP